MLFDWFSSQYLKNMYKNSGGYDDHICMKKIMQYEEKGLKLAQTCKLKHFEFQPYLQTWQVLGVSKPRYINGS